MKNLLKVVFVAAFAMFANSAFAQQKFAHINRGELIQLMPDYKTAGEKLDAYGKELNSNLEEMQVENNKKIEDFQKNSETWSAEKKEVKSQEIVTIQQRLREQQTVAEEQFNRKQEELIMPVIKKATDAINKVAKAGGYIYVFEASTVNYVDETQSTNLLPAVKKELGIN
ncbi:MAG: OmpH family outer membrane protein [Prevotellaceae bacterium]|jgi:outer membrane protein|nr:OmpH family outer membrane protein [Prevotellaceae bacterium]